MWPGWYEGTYLFLGFLEICIAKVRILWQWSLQPRIFGEELGERDHFTQEFVRVVHVSTGSVRNRE